jgi:hypothetical protein
MVKLMQDEINMPSSFIAFLLQFQMKASYLVMVSYFCQQDETKQMLFWDQLGWSPINAV